MDNSFGKYPIRYFNAKVFRDSRHPRRRPGRRRA